MMEPRTDWTREEIASLFDLRFSELAFRAAEVHRAHHSANEVQLSTRLSIKTGGCVEDCGYCSHPVKALVPVKRTVLGDMLAEAPLAKIDDIEFVRTLAVSRITMPLSMARLSAGRESMSLMTQAMRFIAGAASIFTDDKLLTAPNAGDDTDIAMFTRLGIKPMAIEMTPADVEAQRMPKGCAKLEAAE